MAWGENAAHPGQKQKHPHTPHHPSTQIPSDAQARALSAELERRSALTPATVAVIDALPTTTHPMTQLATAVLAMQPDSKMAAAYEAGLHKSRYWEPVLEDSLDLIARLPAAAARIYRRTYHGGAHIPAAPGLDWAANLSHMMGFDDPEAYELMRLYQTIHTDHEGGNVSAHTTHVVGSALSDPYYAFAAGLCGLAGPLHGLANQEVLRFLLNVRAELGDTPSESDVEAFVWKTLKSGKVVPGYGHAVLRGTDPRYLCQRQFALKNMPDDPLFQLVSQMYEIVPAVLTATGKVKNPWPNVDAHSGVLLQKYGIVEEGFYTVLFGVSRAIGVLAQGVWSRALGLPIERPKSVTMAWMEAKFGGVGEGGVAA